MRVSPYKPESLKETWYENPSNVHTPSLLCLFKTLAQAFKHKPDLHFKRRGHA